MGTIREFMPLMTSDKFFSKREDFPQRLPWELIKDCEQQAQSNHSQSLDRLAERGGLHPVEAYLIMRGMSLRNHRTTTDEEAAEFIEKKMVEYKLENSKVKRLEQELSDCQKSLQAGFDYAKKTSELEAQVKEARRVINSVLISRDKDEAYDLMTNFLKESE